MEVYTCKSFIFSQSPLKPVLTFLEHKRLSRKFQKYYFFIIDFDAETNQDYMNNEFLI